MKLLVVRMGAMGDIIHTLPSAATLRRAFPQAEIDWLVEDRWAELLDGNPHINAARRIYRRNWSDLWNTVGDLRAKRYDLILDFQGLLKSAAIARLSAPRELIGFRMEALREKLAAAFYDRHVARHVVPRGAHIVEQNLELAHAAGAKESVLEFPLPAGSAPPLPFQEFFALSPSAGWAAKRWPVESYAKLILRANAELGLRAAINCGPGDEDLAARVAELAREAQPLIVKGGMAELVAVIRKARAFVAGDTGPLHVAAAVGTPVVAIFGPTDPARNGPYTKRARILRATDVATTYSRSAGSEAVARITVEQVVTALREMLQP
jgi:heptosyltransferase-1